MAAHGWVAAQSQLSQAIVQTLQGLGLGLSSESARACPEYINILRMIH